MNTYRGGYIRRHNNFGICAVEFIENHLPDMEGDDFDAAWTALGVLIDLAVLRPLKQNVQFDSERTYTLESPHDAAVRLGREGGKKGGPARAAALTPERRSAIAQHAAEARWNGKDGEPTGRKQGDALHNCNHCDAAFDSLGLLADHRLLEHG